MPTERAYSPGKIPSEFVNGRPTEMSRKCHKVERSMRRREKCVVLTV
jgi:hypothetical protein